MRLWYVLCLTVSDVFWERLLLLLFPEGRLGSNKDYWLMLFRRVYVLLAPGGSFVLEGNPSQDGF